MDYIRRQYGRKRILIFTLVLICMFSLVLGISLHGVSSYLAAASPAITNEFSANLDIDIAESDSGDGDDNEYTNTYEMVPGEDIEDNDPVVTIPKDTIDCWVYITIEKSDNFDEYLKYELAEGWTALGDDYPGTYYRMVETDKDKDQSFAVLKENKVKLQDGVDDDMINAIENPPQLMITAYAVQKASFEGKPLEAWENTFGSGTAAYLFAKTNTIINTYVSGIAPYGAVRITKNVEHKYGDDYIIPDNISFSFDVDMGKDCAGMKFCDDKYTADENGIVSLTLKDKNEVVLNKIPVGTKVKVTEKNLKKGFKVKGEATRTKEVEKAKTSEFDYVNEYEAEAPDFSKVKVFGAKEISGRAWIDTDSYKIVLEQYKNNAWQKITDKEVKKGSNTFDFSEAVAGIDVNNIGTYSFKISEEAGEAGGITYDTNISCFDIVVTDSDMDGKMEIADVISSSSNTNVTKNEETGKFDVKVTFTNKYAPAGSAETFVNITKKLDVVSGGERTLAGYKFELYDEDGNKAGEAFSNAAGEAVIKMVFEPEDAGMPEDGGKEFTYKLKEINLKEPGVIYDSKEYAIKVSVVDNLDGTISAYIYDAKHKEIPEDADNEYSAAFTNRYAPKPASVEMTGKKILEGRKLKSDEFTFVLSEADKNFSPVKVLSETKNTASGSFKLNTLSFKSEGEYYYLVTEKTDKKAKGITFDTSTYRVAVKVTDDNNGSLHADASISKEKSDSVWPVDNVTFTNTYKKPASPGTSERGKSNNPKTGDPTDLALWLLVMLTSLEAIVILIVISLMSRTKDH